MKFNKAKTLIIGLLTLMLSSCKVAKFLAEGDVLYKESDIKFESKTAPEDSNDLSKKILAKFYPDANKKFLGLAYTKIWIYYKINPNPNREKGFRHWLTRKFAEEPVLLRDIDIPLMEKIANKAMQDDGYFNTKTNHKVFIKKDKARIVYTNENKGQSVVDVITYPRREAYLDSIIVNYKNYKTKVGKAYSLESLEHDRIGLIKEIRSNGYFDFDEQDIFYLVDTARVDNLIKVHIKIKTLDSGEEYRRYYVKQVNIFVGEEITMQEDSVLTDLAPLIYKGYYIYQNESFIGKKALANNILIEPKGLFSIQDHHFTIERLSNLGVFNYVLINYTKGAHDSLIVDIKLTQGKHQGFNASIEAPAPNRSFLGNSLALSYDNRNLFKGAENLRIQASSGTELQFVNKDAALNILNVDLNVSISVPRLLTLFGSTKLKSVIPAKSSINIEETYQQWLQYYTMNSFNLSATYDWRTKKNHHHQLSPFTFNVTTLLSTTDEFDEILSNNLLLRNSFNSSVIMGRNYTYSVSNQKSVKDKSYINFKGFAELAGNLNYIVAKIFQGASAEPYKIFNIPFAQFVKFDAEIKHHFKINSGSNLVTRFNAGFGFAYGNSDILPYLRQFYMGGPNTIRAFSFQSLGPGAFSSSQEENADNIINPIEQAGDIKLLWNIEYRYNIYKFIKGAFFLDAGNVWMRKEDPERPGSGFAFNSFYQQIALGSGLGLRLDFDFLVIRADLGLPIYKPYASDGERWIHQFPEQNFKDWRMKNWVWNIAIGYPF